MNFKNISKIPLNFNFEKFWRIFKFLFKFLNKFFQNFTKSLWWVYFLLNFTLNWNFGEAIAVQDLSGIHVWNFVCCVPPPHQNKIWRRPWFSSWWYYDFSRWSYWHFCIQFCSRIKFYSVIFCIFCGILYFQHLQNKSDSPEAKSWSRHW